MKFSASVIDCSDRSLPETVKELDLFGIDFLHVDCLDDPAVLRRIPELRTYSKKPIDLHLITPRPSRYYDDLLKLGVELVCWQYETLQEELSPPSDLKSRVGLAIQNHTPVDVFADFADRCSFVLLMTTEPGKSGGKFNRDTFERIREFRRKFPGKRVHVDGGVDDQISFALRQYGVYCCVSGSFLTRAASPASALLKLRVQTDGQDLRVGDFMISRDELPVLHRDAVREVGDLLAAIESARMGLVLVVDSDDRLEAIATDGDLRRAFLKNRHDFNAVTTEQALNRSPRTVQADHTVATLMAQVKADPMPALFFPVINGKRQLLGLVSFADLIKGES